MQVGADVLATNVVPMVVRAFEDPDARMQEEVLKRTLTLTKQLDFTVSPLNLCQVFSSTFVTAQNIHTQERKRSSQSPSSFFHSFSCPECLQSVRSFNWKGVFLPCLLQVLKESILPRVHGLALKTTMAAVRSCHSLPSSSSRFLTWYKEYWPFRFLSIGECSVCDCGCVGIVLS